jgi:hypothetical protein
VGGLRIRPRAKPVEIASVMQLHLDEIATKITPVAHRDCPSPHNNKPGLLFTNVVSGGSLAANWTLIFPGVSVALSELSPSPAQVIPVEAVIFCGGAAMLTHQGLGPDDRDRLQNRREPSI